MMDLHGFVMDFLGFEMDLHGSRRFFFFYSDGSMGKIKPSWFLDAS